MTIGAWPLLVSRLEGLGLGLLLSTPQRPMWPAFLLVVTCAAFFGRISTPSTLMTGAAFLLLSPPFAASFRLGPTSMLRVILRGRSLFLARSITKWTKACDKRLNRLISYIHHTCEYRQYCHVGNTARQCRLGLFQDSDFAGDLEDSKSTSGGIFCVFGSHTFVPIRWMCKKQTSVSHSSTEAEVISLDAGLRMDGIPALDLWDLVIAVCHSSPNQTNKTKDVREPRRNLSATPQSNMRKQIPTTNTNLDLTNIDHVPSSGTRSGSNAMLYVFEG